MANYRQIHVSIWKDEWFLELAPDEKLFFVYLFSNELASLSGIYKLPLRVMAFETGLSLDFVKAALHKFELADKVYFEDGIVWVKNLRKYNKGGSTVNTRIEGDIQEIPHCELKRKYMAYYYPDVPYGYPMDGLFYEMKWNEMKGKEEEEKIHKTPAENISSSSSSFYPSNAKEAAENPEIKIFREVSGVFPGLRDYRTVIDTIQFLRKAHKDDEQLRSYLMPFWLAWDNRKTKNGNPFAKTNPTWLTEWAVSNNIPNSNEQPKKQQPKRVYQDVF